MISHSAIFRLIVVIGLALTLLSCSPDSGTGHGSGSLVKDFIVPRAGRDVYLGGPNASTKPESDLRITIQLKTTLTSDQILQDIREENLDADPSYEQLVVFKQKDDQEDLLRILIVDFDEARGVWASTWQGATRATNIKTMSVRILNLNSSSLPEIVFQGTNSKGEQTLDIFHIINKGVFPLEYQSVLSISADISIDVTAPDSAQGMESEAAAIPASDLRSDKAGIISESKDLESSSPLDMIQTRYQWKSASGAQAPGQYLVVSSTKILGATVQEAALDQLFKSDVSDIERKYLDGGWVHNFVNQRKKNITQMIFFDSNARSIRLIEGDRMEAHEWVSSHKPAYGTSVQVYMVNESFHSLRTVGTVQVSGLNSLVFALQDRDDWKGEFTRLSADLENKYFSSSHQAIPINNLVLSGLYRNESGSELVFDASQFTWRTGSITRKGGFATYQLNDTVLELEYVDDKGLVTERAWYIAKASELDQGQQTQRILELQAATVTVNGVQALVQDPIRLEQAYQDLAR